MSKAADKSVAKAPAGPKTYRILTLGDSAVGKTCLLRFYRGDTDPTLNALATVGIDMVRADAEARGIPVKLQIWVSVAIVIRVVSDLSCGWPPLRCAGHCRAGTSIFTGNRAHVFNHIYRCILSRSVFEAL